MNHNDQMPWVNHLPINHPFRALWRVLAALVGIYLVVFGILGAVRSYQLPPFAQPAETDLPVSLGLNVNLAFSILSIAVGVAIVAACCIGRNVDHITAIGSGTVFILAGLFMLALLRSDLNFLGFTMATCVVSFVMGLIMLTAGLYCRTGSRAAKQFEHARRHRTFGSNRGVIGDP